MSNCNFYSIKTTNQLNLYGFSQLTILIDYIIFIFCIPVISILCFFLNFLGIYGLSKNSKSKELKNVQYKFIKVYSFLSLVYVVLKLLDMINECSFKNGLFCSSLVSSQLVQYYKIIFNDFIIRVIKTCINVSLICYTVFRLNIFLKPGSKSHILISNLSIPKLCLFILFSFSLICAPRLFIHRLNNNEPNLNYPNYLLDSYSSFIINNKGETTLIFLNLLSDFINNFLIVLINFILDISLTFKLNSDIKKMLPAKRSQASKIKLRQIIISLIMILINMILKSMEFFHSFYFLLQYLSFTDYHIMETKFDFFLQVICLQLSFPTAVNHFLDLSFLVLNVLNYLIYFFGDKNFRDSFFISFYSAIKIKK